ncbi:MAG: RNA polymerase sigma factor [Planctomycetota bacterium]
MDSTSETLGLMASTGSTPESVAVDVDAVIAPGSISLVMGPLSATAKAKKQVEETSKDADACPAGATSEDGVLGDGVLGDGVLGDGVLGDGGSVGTAAAAAKLSAAELESWFAIHFVGVYRYAYRLSGQHATAEDLTQQTFTTALRFGGDVRSAEAIRSWLLRVCRRLFIRSLSRERQIVDGLETSSLPAKESHTVWDVDVRDSLQAAIAALPEDFRVVVLMFYFEDISYREIADELGVPIGTVMSRLSRAKAQLRSVLGPADLREPE